MVAEFLMGTTGLGYLFAKTKSDFQTEQAFGASLVATVISATAFLAGRLGREAGARALQLTQRARYLPSYLKESFTLVR